MAVHLELTAGQGVPPQVFIRVENRGKEARVGVSNISCMVGRSRLVVTKPWKEGTSFYMAWRLSWWRTRGRNKGRSGSQLDQLLEEWELGREDSQHSLGEVEGYSFLYPWQLQLAEGGGELRLSWPAGRWGGRGRCYYGRGGRPICWVGWRRGRL